MTSNLFGYKSTWQMEILGQGQRTLTLPRASPRRAMIAKQA
jgi:hypothetical protein